MTKICSCGNCEQAFNRGAGILTKMMADNECPIFAMAVAEAMLLVCVQTSFDRGMQIGIPPIVTAAKMAHLSTDVESKIHQFAMGHQKWYVKMVDETLRRYNEMVERIGKDHEEIKKGD